MPARREREVLKCPLLGSHLFVPCSPRGSDICVGVLIINCTYQNKPLGSFGATHRAKQARKKHSPGLPEEQLRESGRRKGPT